MTIDVRTEPVKLETLIARGTPPPIPFGWYNIGHSDELAVGQVKPMHYFDTDFVIWRGGDGVVRATDAFCAHLGAHLGFGGRVIGNDIACPFHEWQYNGSGQVTEIPYAKVVPPQLKRECLHGYHIVEMNRHIVMWYHPDRSVKPMWEPVKIDELDNPGWAPYESYEWVINTHIRDLAENSCDYPHFFYVHKVAELPSRGEITETGYTRDTLATVKYVTPRGPVEGQIFSTQTGPGQAYVRFSGLLDTIMVPTVIPISPTQTLNRFSFTQPEGIAGTKFGKALVNEIVRQLEQDKPIWDHKRMDHAPILVGGDGPINGLRQYFAKFYA